MGNLGDKSYYESLRDARISENMARMEMLGLRRRAGELSVIAIASASAACRRAGSATPRKTPKPRVLTPLRPPDRCRLRNTDRLFHGSPPLGPVE